MIYIRNADKFDPANAIEIGMITSPNGWSGLWDGISYNALKTGGFIEQTHRRKKYFIHPQQLRRKVTPNLLNWSRLNVKSILFVQVRSYTIFSTVNDTVIRRLCG